MDILKEHRKIKVSCLKNNNGQFIDMGIPKNPRIINKDKFELLLDSLKQSDLTQIRPLDVLRHGDEYVVLSGNQRLRALKKLKIKEVPCNVLRGDLQNKTYRQIVLQANTNYGEWNHSDLANEWSEEELEMWGYDVPEMDEEDLAPVETLGDDDVPESAPAITVKGDLYILGEHRLLCGDSTMIDDVEKLMDGKKADMVFTDPPYGMKLDVDYSKMPESPNGTARPKKWDNIKGDHQDFSGELISTIFVNFDYCEDIFICGADYFCEVFPDKNSGSWIVWDKRVTENFDRMIGSAFELIWSKKRRKREIARINNTLYSGESDAKNKVHPTQKPLKLHDWIFERAPGHKFVADLFLGSGSTLIACEKTNRKCYGMELDEKYCDVIVKRYIEFCVKNNKEANVYRNGELISNDVFLVG